MTPLERMGMFSQMAWYLTTAWAQAQQQQLAWDAWRLRQADWALTAAPLGSLEPAPRRGIWVCGMDGGTGNGWAATRKINS